MAIGDYLDGPSILGLYDLFDADYGDPETPRPYVRVTPSKVGSALLPFSCPRCKKTIDFTDPEKKGHYRDDRTATVNYFCPSCGARFYLNEAGKPFSGSLSVDGAAPSTTETIVKASDGTVDVKRNAQGTPSLIGFVLGCLGGVSGDHITTSDYLYGTDILGAG